jgi:hypothetical protein
MLEHRRTQMFTHLVRPLLHETEECSELWRPGISDSGLGTRTSVGVRGR